MNGSVAGYTECPTQTAKSNVAGKQTQVITLSSVDTNMINSTICPPPPNLLQSHQMAHQYISNDSLQHGPGSGRCGTLIRASPAPSISSMNQSISHQQYPKSVMVGMTGSLRRVTVASTATISNNNPNGNGVSPGDAATPGSAGGVLSTSGTGGRARISMDGYESVPQTEFELGDLYSSTAIHQSQHPLSHFPPPPQFSNGMHVSSSPMNSSGTTTIVYGETCLGMGCPGIVASATSPVPSGSFPSPSATAVGMEIVETKFESDNLVILTRPNVSSAASSNASVTASVPTSLLSSPGSGSHVVVPVHSFSTTSSHHPHHNHVHLLHHGPSLNSCTFSSGTGSNNGGCRGVSPCSTNNGNGSNNKQQQSSTTSSPSSVMSPQQGQVWAPRDVIHLQRQQNQIAMTNSQMQYSPSPGTVPSSSANGSGHYITMTSQQCSPQLHTQQTQTGSQFDWQGHTSPSE